MSSTMPSKEAVSCPACFETLNNPHKLRCNHTFCMDCIKDKTKGDKAQCPVCNAFTIVRTIKPDPQKQNLVDIYKQNLYVPVEEIKKTIEKIKPKICEVCKDENNSISSKCKECGMFMCPPCEKAHKGFKEFKGHSIMHVEDIMKNIQANLEKTTKYLQTEQEDVAKNYNRLDQMIRDINHARDQQLNEVDRLKEELKQEIDKYCVDLKKVVNDSNDDSIENCMLKKQLFHDCEKEIQVQVNLVKEIIQAKDISVMSEGAEMVDSTVRDNVKQMKIKLPRLDPPVKSCVRVTKGEKWDRSSGPKVVVDRNKLMTTSTSNVNLRRASVTNFAALTHQTKNMLESKFTTFQKSTYRQIRSIELTQRTWRISQIGDNIWGVDNNNIYVYNNEGKCEKTIKLKKDMAVSVTSAHTGDVIVAQDTHGLQQYNPDGEYVGEIMPGNYADVFPYEDNLYALVWKPFPKVLVFSHEGNKWDNDHEIELDYDDCSSFDKLWINGDKIFISSYNNNCMLIYKMNGELFQQTGEQGSDEPGNLRLPWICGVDNQSNALVADRGNHRFQLYNPTRREWNIINFDGNLKEPMQAVIDDTAENIWVITGYPYRLLKYCKN